MEEEKLLTTEDILEELSAGAEAYSTALSIFAQTFTFEGKSLEQHSTDLLVHIPNKPTPDDLQALFAKLSRKIQKASHYYAIANSANFAMVDGTQIQKSDLIFSIAREYESKGARRPAAKVLESIAESYMRETSNAKTSAKILRQFWRERIDSLIETRKCLEQISISISTQMKYLEHE